MTIKNLIAVRSSWIHSAGYSSDRGEAVIRFHSGLVRWYPISVQMWQEFMGASSAGKFFREKIQHSNREKAGLPISRSFSNHHAIVPGSNPEQRVI